MGTTDHDVPFQRTTPMLPRERPPVAKHVVVLGHATAVNSPTRPELATVDQAEPFHRLIIEVRAEVPARSE